MDSLRYVIKELKSIEDKLIFIKTPLSEIKFDSLIYVPDYEHGLVLSEYALEQIESFLNIPGSKFLRGATLEIRDLVINYYKEEILNNFDKIKLKKLGGMFDHNKLGMWIDPESNVIKFFSRSDIVAVNCYELLESISEKFDDECVYDYEIVAEGIDIKLLAGYNAESFGDIPITLGIGWSISKVDSAIAESIIYNPESNSILTIPEHAFVKPLIDKDNSASAADYILKFTDKTKFILVQAYLRAESLFENSAVEVKLEETLQQLKMEYKYSEEADQFIYDAITIHSEDYKYTMYDIILGIMTAAVDMDDPKVTPKLQRIAGLVLLDNSARCPTCSAKLISG